MQYLAKNIFSLCIYHPIFPLFDMLLLSNLQKIVIFRQEICTTLKYRCDKIKLEIPFLKN